MNTNDMRPPTMEVVVDGIKQQRRVSHVECGPRPMGGRGARLVRLVPEMREGELVFETLAGPPVIVRTGQD